MSRPRLADARGRAALGQGLDPQEADASVVLATTAVALLLTGVVDDAARPAHYHETGSTTCSSRRT
jgi:hypothetical protein